MDNVDSTLVVLLKKILKTNKGAVCCKFDLTKVKKTNTKWYMDKNGIKSLDPKFGFEGSLIVCLSKKDKEKYEIKLFCDKADVPVIRFESKDHTHLNRGEDVPLHERVVPTPHFHIFDDEGYSRAYKNPELLKFNQIPQLKDGMGIFLLESLTSCINDRLSIASQPTLGI